jgi:hypothetical protein
MNEIVFGALKHRRGIAIRYAKLIASSIAVIHVKCLFLYLSVYAT